MRPEMNRPGVTLAAIMRFMKSASRLEPIVMKSRSGFCFLQVLDGGIDLRGIDLAILLDDTAIAHQGCRGERGLQAVGKRRTEHVVGDADESRPRGADLFGKLDEHREALVVLRRARREHVGVVGEDAVDREVRHERDLAVLDVAADRVERGFRAVGVRQSDQRYGARILDGRAHVGDRLLRVALVVEEFELEPAPGDATLLVDPQLLLVRELAGCIEVT